MAVDRYDAVIVAGGRATRLAGSNKPEWVHHGHRLLDDALDAAAGARRTVVVGDVDVPAGVLLTREDPPFGGPVAAVAAGLASLEQATTGPRPAWVLLLASDLPHAARAVQRLFDVDPGDHDGFLLLDDDGRPQWLIGCYRLASVTAQLAQPDCPSSLYGLLESLDLLAVPTSAEITADVDTAADAARWSVTPPGGPS